MRYELTAVLLLSIFVTAPARGQAEATPPASTPITVSLSASIDQKTVPLNRTVLLKIELWWEGNLDQIAMGQVTEPVLSNLEIVGTAASNRVLALTTGHRAIKEITYTLKPKALGMAYIESVTLSYEDRALHQVENLKTQRLSVEVVSPVPEGRTGLPIAVYWILAGLGLIFAGVGLFSIWLRHRVQQPVRSEPVELLEESYLNELCADGGTQPESTAEGFARLSKLLRRYLAARYGLPAREITTQELIAELPESGFPADLLSRCATLLSTADVVKFSGQEAPPAEFQLAYTTLETLLERNLADARRGIEEAQNKAGGKKRNKSTEVA